MKTAGSGHLQRLRLMKQRSKINIGHESERYWRATEFTTCLSPIALPDSGSRIGCGWYRVWGIACRCDVGPMPAER